MSMLRQQSGQPSPSCQHAGAEAYATYIQGYTENARQIRHLLGFRARFVRRYPDLGDWVRASLAERVGRLYGEERDQLTCRVSYEARPYLMFLGWHGYAQFDWEWLFAVPRLSIWNLLDRVGQDLGTVQLIEEAVSLGYDREGATTALQWTVSRMFLHTSNPHVESIDDTQLTVLSEALCQFGERSDLALFFGPVEPSHKEIARRYQSHLHLLHVILYHRGQVSKEPRRFLKQSNPRPVMKSRMEAVVARYLTARGLTDRPSTIGGLDRALRQFIGWLAQVYPEVESFAEVTREHLMEFAEAMNTMVGARTNRPLATLTKRGRLSCLSVFFQDVAKWGWNEVPDRPLLGGGDLPKIPARVPRYIPEDELARLMPAIRSLTCPYQRAALLIARWSGARREEIRRLSMDCLDRYADGTARLRIPAGKTKRERIVPLNEEAAAAIGVLQAERKAERGFRDTQTGVVTRYLFVRYGKLISLHYLFDSSLQTVCRAAGLTTADGKPTISAHRFRHTVGTQLAERGAKLRTIMNVLGHSSATMSMVYAQISDREVLKDYQAVLGPGAAIAGPFAETLRSGELSASAVDWLKSNFLKTELELGRCLRLPQEGPCECELYLTCAKFVTTPQYAPRLRRRRRIEQELVEDAVAHGWQREIERHQCTIGRLEQLLTDLREPIEGPGATD
jgi:integrase